MLYLMALQELTKCPFRVVDEINQVCAGYTYQFIPLHGTMVVCHYIFIPFFSSQDFLMKKY